MLVPNSQGVLIIGSDLWAATRVSSLESSHSIIRRDCTFCVWTCVNVGEWKVTSANNMVFERSMLGMYPNFLEVGDLWASFCIKLP